MSYRPGDVPTHLGPLRLTVGALAEITSRLGADSPAELATAIRTLSPDGARHLVMALLRPSGAQGLVARLSDTELAELMPFASACIVGALAATSES